MKGRLDERILPKSKKKIIGNQKVFFGNRTGFFGNRGFFGHQKVDKKPKHETWWAEGVAGVLVSCEVQDAT
jgi:hypothetical protein